MSAARYLLPTCPCGGQVAMSEAVRPSAARDLVSCPLGEAGSADAGRYSATVRGFLDEFALRGPLGGFLLHVLHVAVGPARGGLWWLETGL